MASCYLCDITLNESNKSNEHIILNSCGGVLTSDELLCKQCNNILGTKSDAALSKQLNYFANMLDVKRDRGQHNRFTAESISTKTKYLVSSGGQLELMKPSIDKKQISNGSTNIKISAKNREQAEQILKGLKRNYPNLDKESFMQSLQEISSYINEPLHFQMPIGGKEVFPSVCKTAINFYLYSGGEATQIKHLIPFICGKEYIQCCDIFIPKKYLHNYDEKEISHFIHIRGCSKEKILYGYIEFFNSHIYLITLNENYTGKDCSYTYCYDLIQKKELEKVFLEEWNRAYILSYDYVNQVNNDDFKRLTNLFINRVMSIIMRKQENEHRENLVSNIVHDFFGKYTENTLITEEIVREFSSYVAEELVPFIINRLGLDRK